MSSELKTTVSVDAVNIRFFRKLSLSGLYIEDLSHDTLLYAPEIDITISLLSYSRRKIEIANASLKKVHINLRRFKEVKGLNIDFLANYFSSTSKDTATVLWGIKIKNFNLEDAVFTYRDYRYNDTTNTIDYDDIRVTELNMDVDNIIPSGDSVLFSVRNMKARENSGFVLDGLSGDYSVSATHMDIKNLNIKTKLSNVHCAVRFNFNSWDDFSDFIPKVKMQSTFLSSRIASDDLKYFANELIGLDKTVTFQGSVSGTVDNLKGKKLQIKYSRDCYFKGDLSFKGLPDINETFIDIMADELSVNKQDAESFPAYPFNKGIKLSLPPNFSTLGNVRFKGKFTGFYNDFVAFGTANTAIGFVSCDVNFKLGHDKIPAEYSGSVKTHEFNIGTLLNLTPDVGTITAKMKVSGQSLAIAKLKADLEGEISSLQVKGYKYSGITVNGHIARRLFNGALVIADPNVDLDFKGTVDFSKPKPVFDFTAMVDNAKIGLLNLTDDKSAKISTKAELHCTGNKIDDLAGTLHFSNTNYIQMLQGITINDFYVMSTSRSNYRNIELQSDFADAKIEGDFQLSTFLRSATYVLSKYIPTFEVKGSRQISKQSFSYQVRLKETRGVFDVLLPSLSVVAGTTLEGKFNTSDDEFSAFLKSEEIIYRGIRIGGLGLNCFTEKKALHLSVLTKELQFNDTLLFINVLFAGIANRDSADINLMVANTDTGLSRFNCGFSIKFLPTGYTTIKLIPNEFIIQRKEWKIDPTNYVLYDKSGALFNNFNLSSGQENVFISGIIGPDTSSNLNVELKKFDVSILNNVINIYNANIGGTADGKLNITSLLNKPVIQSELSIKDLSWFGDTLGDADAVSIWNTPKGKIDINGFITRGGTRNIAVNGAYIFHDKEDEIDFDIVLQKTYLKSFSHYLTGLCSDISGIASGRFKLAGLLSSPELTGTATLQKVGFRVDYLNTYYNFSTDVKLTENEIVFKDVIVSDRKANKAIASGTITHDHLRDFYFDVDIATHNTLLLNTTYRDNDLYFGTVNGTGNIRINGYLDYLKMDIAMRSEKGTKINIPLNNPEEVSSSSFITFIKTDSLFEQPVKGSIDLGGLDINLDLEVTNDANIKLIFDDKIGDVIEGNGNGTIKMRVNDADGFLMYGNYFIEEGQYTFTLQNVISKPFTIEKGGSISWTGNPYDADVNINAIYSKLRVNLFDLLQDTSSNYRKPIPVTLRLKLTEKLFNPVIGFDIEVPNIDAATSSRIQRYISTEEQKFKQAVSLLILRRFSPPDELANRPNTSGAVGANAYEFLSQQLSNWASQIDKNVNVGINYNPGNALTQEELELALSTSIFNDRVTLEGNVGVAGNNNSNTSQNASNIVGDFSVDVKASKDGKVRLKAFNRSNNNTLINTLNAQYTQGIGVFYREEFNSFSELRQRWKDRRQMRKAKKQSIAPAPEN